MRAFPNLAFILLPYISLAQGAVEYYGKFLAPLKSFHHGVSGDVYAVDARTLHIRDFTYDGEGPAAYFYVGGTKVINGNGHRLLDERGLPHPLKRYRKKHITLTLPEGKTLANVKWFAVWCDEAAVNFGDVKIPKNLDFPKPQKIAPLNGVHAVSSEPIVVVDAQTLLIPSFSYDGEAPDAKFWVGRGAKPSPQGIRVPDENGKEVPLRRYDRKTIVLTLPGDLTVFEIGHFGVWCEAFTVDFGHIQLPSGLNVPPSLKMLGVSPQSKLNCEVLHEELAFEVRWAVAGDSVVVQLVAKLEDGEYMSFGLSGHERKNQMIGADVTVAWVDHDTLNGFAEDYFLDDKSQCSGSRGSCPDYRIDPENTNSVRLLNAALVNGYSIVTYQRTLRAHDSLDLPIYTNTSQAIIWAVGPLNQKREVSFHSVWSKSTILMDFGRTPLWNCPIPESDAALGASNEPQEQDVHVSPSVPNRSTVAESQHSPPPPAPAVRQSDAWEIPPIQCNEPDDGVFYAQMGPTGGKRGYPSITKHVGWGISYYINGLLIPEINVVRGKTYTFVVEGGLDPTVPAKYHPFYITDDPVGGFANKSPEEQKKVRIFAGVEESRGGELVPTGSGRLCNWTPDPEQPPADEFVSFGAYQRTLTLICDHGEPGVIQWTPDEDTPDTVYYQCFVHRYLGWKINVLDQCDLPVTAGSSQVESRIKYEPEVEELESRPSTLVSARVKPDGPNHLPLVSDVGLKYQNQLSEYKKTFAQIPHITLKEAQSHSTEPPTVIAANHKYPPEVSVSDTTEDGREMIPVSEDTSQDISTEKSKPMLSEHKDTHNRNASETKHQSLGVPYSRNPYSRPHLRRPVMSTMTIIRPQHRRPAPHHHMVVVSKPMMHRPLTLMAAPSQYRPVFVKKPIYRVPGAVHRPMVVMPPHSHPLETMMVPPRGPANPQQVSQSVSVSYSTSKGKEKLQVPIQIKTEPTEMKKYILPQQQKPQKLEYQHATYKSPYAVNTGGFNPGSLVIEGGFKPIIQNAQEAQDRISEVEESDDTEGTVDLTVDDDMLPDVGTGLKATEYFEPMFIPSPPDSLQKRVKKPTGLEYDTLQKKKPYISRKPVRQNMVVIRRRPVSPSFRSQQEDVADETPMAAERMDTYYLPPSGPVYGVSAQAVSAANTATLLTYDGKTVSVNSVVPAPASTEDGYTKRRSSVAELLRSTPQFGPFMGDIPPPVPDKVRTENIPQLSQALATRLGPEPAKRLERDRIVSAASDLKEYLYTTDKHMKNKTDNYDEEVVIVLDKRGTNDSALTEVRDKAPLKNRNKRSVHSVPGHEEDHDDHLSHDHDHQTMTGKNRAVMTSVTSPIVIILVSVYTLRFWQL
ncbi:protein Skeletor, isoforms D/E-like [Homalodisca vitripennis]|nr:protein Skeletor, isoforms D/E-like [Homalodisca vitripennis]